MPIQYPSHFYSVRQVQVLCYAFHHLYHPYQFLVGNRLVVANKRIIRRLYTEKTALIATTLQDDHNLQLPRSYSSYSESLFGVNISDSQKINVESLRGGARLDHNADKFNPAISSMQHCQTRNSSSYTPNETNKEKQITYDALVGIVSTLKERQDWKHWRYQQQQSLSSDRHKLERKAKLFCSNYQALTKLGNNDATGTSQRRDILDYLLSQTVSLPSAEVKEIHDVIDKYHNVSGQEHPADNSSDLISSVKTLHQLKRACTPLYEDLVNLLLQAAAGSGLQFLITLRQDLFTYKKQLKEKQRLLHQQQSSSIVPPDVTRKQLLDLSLTLEQLDLLDNHLRRILAVQFAPGFLDVRRITYQHSPAATIEVMARNEAVHPVRGLPDLRARLSLNRRVFGLFHPMLVPDYVPAVVLYVSLQPTVPASMYTIHNQEKDFPPTEDVGSIDNSATTPPAASAKVAAFYSISNLQAGLAGVGLGEYLIKRAAGKLQQEIPSLETFVTLSPIPNFRKWLRERAAASSDGSKFAPEEDSKQFAWINPADLHQLSQSLGCEPKDALLRLVEILESDAVEMQLPKIDASPKRAFPNVNVDLELLKRIFTRLAAHYLVQEKHRRKPLDVVARFHIANGAEVYQINFGADLSRKGWSNSFGIMVNYRYNMPDVQTNQDRYELDFSVPVNENVTKVLQCN